MIEPHRTAVCPKDGGCRRITKRHLAAGESERVVDGRVLAYGALWRVVLSCGHSSSVVGTEASTRPTPTIRRAGEEER